MAKLPIPVIIYRLRPEEAYEKGVWADVVGDVGDIGQLQNSPLRPSLPALALPILAALSTEEGLAHSAETKSLWLLHPQLQELQVYRGNPALLALKQSPTFYEAYLSHNSSAVPYRWYSETQLELWQQQERFAPSNVSSDGLGDVSGASSVWLENSEKQAFLGALGNHFSQWQESGHKIFSGSSHAELPSKLKEAAEFLEQEFHKSAGTAAISPNGTQAEQLSLSDAQHASADSLVSLPLQSKWSKRNKSAAKQQSSETINPAEAWLLEAQASLKDLHSSFCDSAPKTRKSAKAGAEPSANTTTNSDISQASQISQATETPKIAKTPKEQQSIHLAQTLWALLAFWISAKLSPTVVLRKLAIWLDREKTHVRLQEQFQKKLQEETRAKQAQVQAEQNQSQAEQNQAGQNQAEQAEQNQAEENQAEENPVEPDQTEQNQAGQSQAESEQTEQVQTEPDRAGQGQGEQIRE